MISKLFTGGKCNKQTKQNPPFYFDLVHTYVYMFNQNVSLTKQTSPNYKCCSYIFLFQSIYFLNLLLNLLGWHQLITFSRFQGYNSIVHRLYCIACSPPQVKSSSDTIYPPLLFLLSPALFPYGNHHTIVCVQEGVFFFV